MDFFDLIWFGCFGFVFISGVFFEQVVVVIKFKGQEEVEDWLIGLKVFGLIYINNVIVMKVVENGEVDMVLINNYYWYILKKEKGELNLCLYYFGNQDLGVLVIVFGVVVFKFSKYFREVQQFVVFMFSEEGQKMIFSQFVEYLMCKGMQVDLVLKLFVELDLLKLILVDLGEVSEVFSFECDVGLN